jgi:secreted trypsin-like serine protease
MLVIKNIYVMYAAAGVLTSACGSVDSATQETPEKATQSIVRGTAEAGRPYVVELRFERYSGGARLCSGSYFAPRVVVTAGHCIPSDAIPGRVFAYWGSNLEADLPLRNSIPPVGQPTVWAKADSWQVHPSYSSATQDADMGVVYLDRKPPFDPLPLYRNNLGASWIGKKATLVGWGALQALSADIQTNVGAGVKRTGQATILGTPTAADYHADDPNPAMLSATARSHYVKLDGHAPNANGCAGDSGGPIIVNAYGQDYVAGVASWTGLWCEDYSLYTRIDPYLPFLDEAYKRGGQDTVIPYLDCVYKPASGNATAYFGYKNNNGVGVSVPYDPNKNALALDVNNERPTLFAPGDKHFQFGIDFTQGQTVTWKLSPTNSPTTIVNATTSSTACVDDNNFKCVRACESIAGSSCAADFGVDYNGCMTDCAANYGFMTDFGCEAGWSAYLKCTAGTPPAAANWECGGDFYYQPTPVACDDLLIAAWGCIG